MKKIWYAFMLLSVILAGCNNTDDLWDEVNDLKKRVTALETQIRDLNGNIEALRELCKEGATITTVAQKDGAYIITLSDGKVLNLVEKTENTALFPLVAVDANGFWTVSYDNGKSYNQIKDASNNPIKATGTDGATPKFRTDTNGYWQVDYNDGNGYTDVLDENGQKVNALGNGGGSGSETTDKFFKEVTVKDGELYIKMTDNTELSVPIVSDFECSFATDDLNKVHEFAAGETREFIMTVKGVESTMITAPAGWKVRFSKEAGKENTLIVTAPGVAARTAARAAADNSTDIAILATHGKFATIAKIQVSVKEVVDYKAMYDAGEDIIIGGVTVNKTTFTALTIPEGTTNLSPILIGIKDTPSVLFLDETIAYTLDAKVTVGGSIAIIGKVEGLQPTITPATNGYFPLQAANGKLLIKNISFNLINRPNYMFNQESNAGEFGTLALDRCKMINAKSSIIYVSILSAGVNNISIKNSYFKYTAAKDTDIKIFSSGGALSNYKSFEYKNNTFYSENILKGGIWVENAAMVTDKVMIVENNTFINITGNGTTAPYLKANLVSNLSMQNNVFYANDVLGSNPAATQACSLYLTTAASSGSSDITVTDNKVFNPEGTNYKWYNLFGNTGADNTITPETETPFSTFDPVNDIFTTKNKNYGAQ